MTPRVPPPITNDALVDPATGQPRPNLKKIDHYRGVNERVWSFFLSQYGGGPTIKRSEIDLYAPPAE